MKYKKYILFREFYKNVFRLRLSPAFIISLSLLLLSSLYLSLFSIEHFTTSELIIHDENKPTYNIGDLTLMYFYYGTMDKPIYDDNKSKYIDEYIKTKKEYYDIYPNSIFSNYIKLLDEKVNVEKASVELPELELIQKATDMFYDKNKESVDSFFNAMNNERTLFVHLRSGDKGNLDDSFINAIQKLEQNYEKVIIICGSHNQQNDEHKNKLINDVNKIMNEKYIININEPDHHLCYFRKCKHLLVCKGGFSALGCVLFNGDNLYYMSKMMNEHGEYNQTWIDFINKKKIIYLENER